MPLISSRFLALAALLTTFVSASAATSSFAQEIKTTTTYQVPTTGEIVDVIYRPEFDEWWVKCREGKTISVYSYSKKSKKWARALFVPQKPVEKGKKSTKPGEPRKPEEPAGSPDIKDRQPEELKERGQSPEAAGTPQGFEHPPKKSEPARDKKKWWDPFNLLKGSKKTLPPVDGPLP